MSEKTLKHGETESINFNLNKTFQFHNNKYEEIQKLLDKILNEKFILTESDRTGMEI